MLLARASAKPKRREVSIVPMGSPRPMASAARAMKPRPAVMLVLKLDI